MRKERKLKGSKSCLLHKIGNIEENHMTFILEEVIIMHCRILMRKAEFFLKNLRFYLFESE